jgi:hypothetical protein
MAKAKKTSKKKRTSKIPKGQKSAAHAGKRPSTMPKIKAKNLRNLKKSLKSRQVPQSDIDYLNPKRLARDMKIHAHKPRNGEKTIRGVDRFHVEMAPTYKPKGLTPEERKYLLDGYL